MKVLPTFPRLRALLLDFDGVILASAALKTQAFVDLYADADPTVLAAIAEYVEANGGVSRHDKLATIEREFFRRAGSPDDVARLAARFRARVFTEVLAAPYVPGAQRLLDRAFGRVDMHVVSGTPQAELVEIVERRGLARWFASYRGTPPDKRAHFAALLAQHGYRPDEVLAVGDAPTEYDAAVELGVPFLAVVPAGACRRFPPDVPAVATLEAVTPMLGLA